MADDDEVPKSEPKKGIVGIDLIAVPRMKGESARCGVENRVTLVRV